MTQKLARRRSYDSCDGGLAYTRWAVEYQVWDMPALKQAAKHTALAEEMALTDYIKGRELPETKEIAFICHGDCIDDANMLSDILKNNFGSH